MYRGPRSRVWRAEASVDGEDRQGRRFLFYLPWPQGHPNTMTVSKVTGVWIPQAVPLTPPP